MQLINMLRLRGRKHVEITINKIFVLIQKVVLLHLEDSSVAFYFLD